MARRDDLRRSADEAQVEAGAPIEAAHRDARLAADESGLAGAETVVEVGDPAAVVTRVAEERRVDVILVGSHSRGWLERLFGSSVSKQVVEHTHTPVLVAK